MKFTDDAKLREAGRPLRREKQYSPELERPQQWIEKTPNGSQDEGLRYINFENK